MSTLQERNFISESIEQRIIPKCCNGNKAAEAYLRRVFFIVRMADDFFDEDVEIQKENIFKALFVLLGELPTNQFYKENIDILTGIHIMAFNAWQDANTWEKDSSELKQMYAHVIRDMICELFAMVGFLTGGQQLMKETSLMVREIFLKEMEP